MLKRDWENPSRSIEKTLRNETKQVLKRLMTIKMELIG